jgi:hypothetical protein
MTIPSDNVDEEQLQRLPHWDTAFIRRFMTFFGPISSIFAFATFGIMIRVFNAHAPLFRSDGKRRFYRVAVHGPWTAHPPDHERRIHHRASRWSTHARPHPPGVRPETSG